MNRLKILLLFVALPLGLCAQRKPLDHSVYDSWQRVEGIQLSNNGVFAAFSVSPQEGDKVLHISNLKKKNELLSIERGAGYTISENSQYLVSLINPLFEETRQAKIKKKKPEDMPKDSLAIVTLASSKVEKLPYVKSFKLPEKASHSLAYLQNPPADTAKKAPKREKDEGTPLIIRQLLSGKEDTIRYVSEYYYSKNGDFLVAELTPNSKDSLATAGVLLYNTRSGERKMLSKGKGSYQQFSFDEQGKQLAYVAERDSAKAEPKLYKLYYYAPGQDSAIVLAHKDSQGMPKAWSVSGDAKPLFSKSGSQLYLGIAPIPTPKDTTLVDFETARLDVWHYNDDYVQPMQLKTLERELKRSYVALVDLAHKDHLVQLQSENISSFTINEESENYALATSDKAYRKETQWMGAPRRDVYAVSLITGEQMPVVEGLFGNAMLSPKGKYVLFYDRVKRHYYAYGTAGGFTVCLTDKLGVNVWDEKNDVPQEPESYGIAGWLADDKAVLVYDAYDIWQLDPSGALTPVNVTGGVGRADSTTFRYIKTDSEAKYISEKEPMILGAFNNVTKQNGFYTKQLGKKKEAPIRRVLDGYTFSPPVKAKNANVLLFTQSNFSTTPNLFKTSDWWKTQDQLTHINPQMDDYLWGSVELIKYKTYDGIDAEALLYKPDDFDPSKKYPMIIYFYEKHTENLYRHYAPAPSRSTINIPFFCSRGYLVLVPDIYYKDGYPGQSAYNSVVAVTEEVCKNAWVDRKNIGIQGQSWGGYQVAYLITRTNIYKAAGAGAPVANMTSAYGGIRWGSGMVRQFQYEHQQSRIGKTLWDGFELYKENSPLFYADKVETPLLIMHNDNDDAVPWYQGIEYFTALSRLGKKVWMLQYNNETHNISERRNAKDLSIRLQQFFDYYLKGEKMPEWMKNGVPATKKGKDWGLSLED